MTGWAKATVTNPFRTHSATRTQSYTYDSLNRLSTAGTATTWGDQYGYDAWGNLLSKTVTRGTAESISLVVNGNNQLPGWGYDGAGNLVGSPQLNFFNAENQWTSQNTFHVSYLYDGDGNRVQASGGASGTRVYWKDEGGRVMYEAGAHPTDYFYLGGEMIARTQYGPLTYYYQDELGTTRIQTTSTGSVCYDADYFPWGDEQHVYTNTCAQNYKFNGKERDPDMGVYDFGARFMQDAIARFYSPDWSATVEPVPYAKLGNPQTLNLYAYVLNNPTTTRDPSGHCGADGTPCSTDLTVEQITGIVFNETQSLSGNGVILSDARQSFAHMIINGDNALGDKRPSTAKDKVSGRDQKTEAYKETSADVKCACDEAANGIDPTNGATKGNLRPTDSTAPFQGADQQTQSGPLNNSFPSKDLPKGKDVYIDTYKYVPPAPNPKPQPVKVPSPKDGQDE